MEADIRKEGFEGRMDGLHWTDNPYADGSIERDAWDEGYWDADYELERYDCDCEGCRPDLYDNEDWTEIE